MSHPHRFTPTRLALWIVAVLLTATGAPAWAQTGSAKPVAPSAALAPVRLKMQTAFNPSLSVMGEATRKFSTSLRTMSSGALTVKILEAGWAAATPDLLDAVIDGSVDAAFTSPTYAAVKQPVLALYAGYPFGPSAEEYVAWILDGDGGRIHREFYARLGVHAIPCGVIGPEAGGWFRNEIKSVADFKDLRLRYSGLAGAVLERFGATIVATPPGEMFFKLQQGKLDGGEFSMPSVDRAIGFERLGLIYHFPGWHQPGAILDFYMRKDRWDALDATQRAQIETACNATIAWTLARAPGEQVRALDYFRQSGVSMRAFPADIIETLRQTAVAIGAERALKDPEYRAVRENLESFLDGIRGWAKLGHP